MKTSNKILLGLLLVLFATPFVLSAMLKYKVRNNDFTVVKYNHDNGPDRTRKGSFSDFKVLKVTAPGRDFLTCHIKQSDTTGFRYYANNERDSVAIETVGDTLNIRFLSIQKGSNRDKRLYGNNLRLDIAVPSLNNLLIDGVVVILDSVPSAARGLTVTLLNQGMISNETPAEKEPTKIDSSTNKSVSITATDGDEESGVSTALLAEEALNVLQTAASGVSMADLKELFVFHLM